MEPDPIMLHNAAHFLTLAEWLTYVPITVQFHTLVMYEAFFYNRVRHMSSKLSITLWTDLVKRGHRPAMLVEAKTAASAK